MFKKMAIAACFASALTMVSAPANAAAYLIGGKWYFFSLDFESTLAKVTGKDLRDITTVAATATVTQADTQCANPQSKVVNPGQGPKLQTQATSVPVTESDLLSRSTNRVTGNTYKAKTVLPLAPDLEAANPCKDSNGVSEWVPTYWRFAGCNRLGEGGFDFACYSELAIKQNGVLVDVVSGAPVVDPYLDPNTGKYANWTFVYLPTVFTYAAKPVVGGVDGTIVTGTCSFPPNNEPGAVSPGKPYSISNPPVLGWARSPVSYLCSGNYP